MFILGDGQMIQQLRALVFTALAQNLDSVPNIHTVTHNHDNSHSKGLHTLFWPPWTPECMYYT